LEQGIFYVPKRAGGVGWKPEIEAINPANIGNMLGYTGKNFYIMEKGIKLPIIETTTIIGGKPTTIISRKINPSSYAPYESPSFSTITGMGLSSSSNKNIFSSIGKSSYLAPSSITSYKTSYSSSISSISKSYSPSSSFSSIIGSSASSSPRYSPPSSPTYSPPYSPPSYPNYPSITKFSGFSFKLPRIKSTMKLGKQPLKYTPSLASVTYGFKAIKMPKVTYSGLSRRPIITRFKKRRKK
jgi:hypothetical protein